MDPADLCAPQQPRPIREASHARAPITVPPRHLSKPHPPSKLARNGAGGPPEIRQPRRERRPPRRAQVDRAHCCDCSVLMIGCPCNGRGAMFARAILGLSTLYNMFDLPPAIRPADGRVARFSRDARPQCMSSRGWAISGGIITRKHLASICATQYRPPETKPLFAWCIARGNRQPRWRINLTKRAAPGNGGPRSTQGGKALLVLESFDPDAADRGRIRATCRQGRSGPNCSSGLSDALEGAHQGLGLTIYLKTAPSGLQVPEVEPHHAIWQSPPANGPCELVCCGSSVAPAAFAPTERSARANAAAHNVGL